MSLKPKILIITGVFLPEPVVSARLNFDLAEALADRYDVTVISPRPSRPYGCVYKNIKPVEGRGFRHIIVDSYTCPKSSVFGRLCESFSFAMAVLRCIKREGINANFIYNCSWHLIGLYLVAKYAVRREIPYIVPVQDIYPESLLVKLKNRKLIPWIIKKIALPIDRYYLSHAACIRTISDDMVDYISSTRKIPRDKFLVVNNWQNDSLFDLQKPNHVGRIVKFSYVGSINASANVEHIVKSYIRAAIDNSQLMVYGDGPNRQKCMDIVRHSPSSNVAFESVTPEEVPSVESNSNVLVLALKRGVAKTALPSKLTAYCLAGRPVIAALDEDSAVARIIRQYDFGIVVPPEDEVKLQSAFKTFAEMDKEELVRLGRNARMCAEQQFLKGVNLQKILNVVSSIVD